MVATHGFVRSDEPVQFAFGGVNSFFRSGVRGLSGMAVALEGRGDTFGGTSQLGGKRGGVFSRAAPKKTTICCIQSASGTRIVEKPPVDRRGCAVDRASLAQIAAPVLAAA